MEIIINNKSSIETKKLEIYIKNIIEIYNIKLNSILINLTLNKYSISLIKNNLSVSREGFIKNKEIQNVKYNINECINEIDRRTLNELNGKIKIKKYNQNLKIRYNKEKSNKDFIKFIKNEFAENLLYYEWENKYIKFKSKIIIYIIGNKIAMKIDNKLSSFIYFNNEILKDKGNKLFEKMDKIFKEKRFI